jgi:pimeloyl-ACP methyl ester carboxylesterase
MTKMESDNPKDGNLISVNDIEMYYEDHGAGPALLLLHGGTGSSKGWEGYFDTFFEGYRIIAPDLRGHGRTNNPSGEWNYSIMADDIASFIKELDLQKPYICGWSDGGQIGLELAIRYPGLASAYIVGGVSKENPNENLQPLREIGFVGPGEVNINQYEIARPEWVKILRAIHSPQGAEYWKELLTGISRLWMTPFNYSNDDLAKIIESTLIIIGDRDHHIPVETAVALYRMIPNSDLAVLPNADHYITRTHVKEFSNLVLDFINRHSS